MTLKSVVLKKFYDSDVDNIVRDFYIPALSKSVLYKRLTGFFSSTSLAVAARGISKLISNDGNVQLITGARFRKVDVEAIKEAYDNPENVIERMMLEELDNIEDAFLEDHVSALGWMVAQKRLEIKVAIVLDEDGYPLDENAVERQGVFHQKVGILEDEDGNRISFSGSNNESATGWLNNIEEFKVFRSWEEAEKEYLESDLKKFEKLWSEDTKRTRVLDIPNAIKNKLIKMAPENIDALNLDRWLEVAVERREIVKLRDYQKEAFNSWLGNDKKGIFEMATGTGKTFAALACLKKVIRKERKIVTVIAVPFIHLGKQWEDEIEKFGIRSETLIADSSNPNWKDKLVDLLRDIQLDISESLIILTTHATFALEDFIRIIRNSGLKFFLIADEVHGVGAPIRREGLIEEYNYRLGLSATPKRWFDLEGTETLFDYFGDIVFSYPIKKAIDDGYLVPYEYKPYFTELTEQEIEQYEEETEKIAKAYYQSKDDEERAEWFSLLCIKRQNIVKNAQNKLIVLKEILRDAGELKHCLVYCSPQQIDDVQDVLNKENIMQHRFTETEGIKPEEEYGYVSERQFLLQNLSKGRLQALVAMRCLDEGVDIPPARLAIMLENSGNPREYIQRRGRVLRPFPGKKHAIIYDIIVIPSLHKYVEPEVLEIEKRILTKELIRYKDFAQIAKNNVECLKRIEEIELKHKIIG